MGALHKGTSDIPKTASGDSIKILKFSSTDSKYDDRSKKGRMHIDLKNAQEPPGMSEMSISHPIVFDTSWKTLLSYLLKKFEIHVTVSP